MLGLQPSRITFVTVELLQSKAKKSKQPILDADQRDSADLNEMVTQLDGGIQLNNTYAMKKI